MQGDASSLLPRVALLFAKSFFYLVMPFLFMSLFTAGAAGAPRATLSSAPRPRPTHARMHACMHGLVGLWQHALQRKTIR